MKPTNLLLYITIIVALFLFLEQAKAEDLTNLIQDTASKEEYLKLQEELEQSKAKASHLEAQLRLEEAKKAYNTAKIRQLSTLNELKALDSERAKVNARLSEESKKVNDTYTLLKILQGR